MVGLHIAVVVDLFFLFLLFIHSFTRSSSRRLVAAQVKRERTLQLRRLWLRVQKFWSRLAPGETDRDYEPVNSCEVPGSLYGASTSEGPAPVPFSESAAAAAAAAKKSTSTSTTSGITPASTTTGGRGQFSVVAGAGAA